MAQNSYNDAPSVAFAGMLADGCQNDIVTAQNAEASAEMRFGIGVEFDATIRTCSLPDAETDKVAGITVHSHAYARPRVAGAGELGDTGVKPGVAMNLLRKGRIWVPTSSTTAIGDRLWIRAVAGGGEFLGRCENADDSTDMIDCTKQGVFLSAPQTAPDGQTVALLEVDFTNEPD